MQYINLIEIQGKIGIRSHVKTNKSNRPKKNIELVGFHRGTQKYTWYPTNTHGIITEVPIN